MLWPENEPWQITTQVLWSKFHTEIHPSTYTLEPSDETILFRSLLSIYRHNEKTLHWLHMPFNLYFEMIIILNQQWCIFIIHLTLYIYTRWMLPDIRGFSLSWVLPGRSAEALRGVPTMVEGPSSPLYISLPRSSIMPGPVRRSVWQKAAPCKVSVLL